MHEPAIKNWKQQPPAGGWSFEWTSPTGRKFMLDSSSPRRIVEKLMDIQRLNKWFISETHVWAECNDVWRKKDPHRAISKSPTVAQLPAPADLVPVQAEPVRQSWWDARPETWGPRAWFWLHGFGAYFGSTQSFDSAVNRVLDMLNPSKSPELGCHKCYEEFRQYIMENPTGRVTNEKEAAAWTFEIHNRVNRKRSILPITWIAAAKLHHWKVAV